MAFANSPATRNVLAGRGVRVGGYRWRWRPGLKGGTFPPHYHQNNEYASDSGDFEALPGEDVNGAYCACQLVPQYRTADGRFARPGLEPVFQVPQTASGGMIPEPWTPRYESFDFSPLIDAWQAYADRPVNVSVSLPDGSVVVNMPDVRVPAPVVNVPVPSVTVPTTVNVDPTPVSVAAPNVTVSPAQVRVEPNITVKPAPVKVIRERVRRVVKFRRNADGLINEATVEE